MGFFEINTFYRPFKQHFHWYTRTVILRASGSSSTNGLKRLTCNSSWQLGVTHLIDIYGTMLSECVMILIAFWTNQLPSSTSTQPVRPVNTTLLCRVMPTPFAWVSTTHRVLDRLDFWHGCVFTHLHSKSMANLFCFNRELGILPQKCSVLEHSILVQMKETVKANPMNGNCISPRKINVLCILHCIKTFVFDD